VIENFNYDEVLTKESIGSRRPILTRYFVFRHYLQTHSECAGVLVTDSRFRPNRSYPKCAVCPQPLLSKVCCLPPTAPIQSVLFAPNRS
jgi:hypothetical protein